MDIEKAFNSLDHTFLISILKDIDLAKTSFFWIQTFFKQSRILWHQWKKNYYIFTAQKWYFSRWPNISYFFIFALEILFLLLKTNSNIKNPDDFNHCHHNLAINENIVYPFHAYFTILVWNQIQVWSGRYKCSEWVQSGSLWHPKYHPKYWNYTNIGYLFFI